MYVIAHQNFNFHTSDERYKNNCGLVHVPVSREPQLIPDDIHESIGFQLAVADGKISVVTPPKSDAVDDADDKGAIALKALEADLEPLNKAKLVEFAQQNLNLELKESLKRDELVAAIVAAHVEKSKASE